MYDNVKLIIYKEGRILLFKNFNEKIEIEKKNIVLEDNKINNSFKEKLLEYLKNGERAENSFGMLCLIHFIKEDNAHIESDRIFTIAAALELMMLSLDIADDLQDQDTENIWSLEVPVAINAVLYFSMKCQETILNSNFDNALETSKIINEYLLYSINGQDLDIRRDCCKEDTYLKMVEMKSGSLTLLCCIVGTLLSNKKVSLNLLEYGRSIGIVQQVNNDINSLKSIGLKNDLLNGKYSLPIIYLLSKNNIGRECLLENYWTNRRLLIPYTNVVDFVHNTYAIQYASIVKEKYIKKAIYFIKESEISEHYKLKLVKYLV